MVTIETTVPERVKRVNITDKNNNNLYEFFLLQTNICAFFFSSLENYWDFHQWSIKHYPQFWQEVWNFYGVICSKPFSQVNINSIDAIISKWSKKASRKKKKDCRLSLILSNGSQHFFSIFLLFFTFVIVLYNVVSSYDRSVIIF